ncbi:hypothetical protein SPBR_07842 [Sporothrix brasiliensis 5110]|uniref:Uncharacterized protein n=1 Tax=Sporothrix brasiliensis 5110 TaxID=1398154 RepID=A0A0C2IUR5_9PEZI|nr:uncharacterized protein SPBR_07842 [Sporothrix brasiliensis 5110]KIH88727.1 hypothetical protein SPBR_07842 [Sporothrix brasiliensis 5110]
MTMDRYAACHVLYQKGIPATCWFEDAVAHHGVPTARFDLFLLVEDMDTAAQVLLHDGWASAATRPNDKYAFYGDENCKPYRRMERPGLPGKHTFLLNAADWAFPVERLGKVDEMEGARLEVNGPPFFPSLPHLVDALIDSILDSKESNKTVDRLIVMLAYLYGYVKEMKKPSFAEQLAYDHRQFHYDTEAITEYSLRFFAHERKVRQQIRDGTLVPYHDPWHNDRECLS